MHLYNRLPLDQVKLILTWHREKKISTAEAMVKLGIKRRQLFYLLKAWKEGRLESWGKKKDKAANRISDSMEAAIRRELEHEKAIITNPAIPTDYYNYTFVRDEVGRKTGRTISAETVRRRAYEWGFFIVASKQEKPHARMILTEKPGVLLQHDSSHHLFAPMAGTKWHLITTLDDFSRKLLYAQLVEEETTWEHILALKRVITTFGIPSNYYVDNHSIFRFVERMESFWRTPRVNHETVLTAWEECLHAVGTGVFHALSPQAKGKIERPYRWMQDRLVRRCAKEGVTTIAQAAIILREEVFRYNAKTVHSTTGEIPDVRFARMVKENNTAFRPFQIPKPYRAIEDVFCIRERRSVSGYLTISWRNHAFHVPAHIPIGDQVTLHIVPDREKPMLRIWYKEELVQVIFLGPDPKRKAYVEKLIDEETNQNS